MNMMVVDAQGVLNRKQIEYALNRLYFGLIRFEHRINGVTMHVARDCSGQAFRCRIVASLEGCGIIEVFTGADDPRALINSAVDAIEPKIARQVDRRGWFNPQSIWAFLGNAMEPLKSFRGSGRKWSMPSLMRQPSYSYERKSKQAS